MDPVLAAQLIVGVNEAAKLGLQLWLAHQHMQGKTPVEIKESFDTELIEYNIADAEIVVPLPCIPRPIITCEMPHLC